MDKSTKAKNVKCNSLEGDVKAALGSSLLTTPGGKGSLTFCRRITSVLSPKMLDLQPQKGEQSIRITTSTPTCEAQGPWGVCTHRSAISLSV